MEGKLTLYFEDPFWVGIFEREDEAGYCVSRIVFGSEPTDVELYEYIRREYTHLDFSQPVKGQIQILRKKNFKRMQREVRKEVYEEGIGTKALQAMKLQMELNKKEHQVQSRCEREEEKMLRFKIKQEKKKQKRRGH